MKDWMAGLPARESVYHGWTSVELPGGATSDLRIEKLGDDTRQVLARIAAGHADGYCEVARAGAATIWHVDLPAGALRAVVLTGGHRPEVVAFRTAPCRQAWTDYLTRGAAA